MKRSIFSILCFFAIAASLSAQDDSKYIERLKDVNLRILDDNIWDYSKETLPAEWEAIGEDCRDDYRAPKFAEMVRRYDPELLALQEYSAHMHARFYPLIMKQGYQVCTTGVGSDWNNTPIFYKADAMELLECRFVLYTPSTWSNHGSKSFTSAVFRHKATGKVVALISTHFWWKSDKAQAGSTYARTSQAYQIIAEAELIKQKYDCPIFTVGDLNCEEKTLPIQAFLNAGFQPCYKIATVYADNHNGHHECGPKGYSLTSHRKGESRSEGAIDHCFLYNGDKSTEVKVFECIQSGYTVPLTDHYPNLIDIRLD